MTGHHGRRRRLLACACALAGGVLGFERELGRFLTACAADQVACSGFGGADPWLAYDELIEQADATPIPAPDYPSDPRPIKGDDLRLVAFAELYAKQAWGDLALALAEAANGNGSSIRKMVDEDWYGRDPDTGAFDPGQRSLLHAGRGGAALPQGSDPVLPACGRQLLGPVRALLDQLRLRRAELRPLADPRTRRVPRAVPRPELGATPLVVNTTYDPATPYRGGLRLVRDLGNARLLTMVGDGHTAYGGNSPCIDAAVEAYLIDRVLPAAGTRCRQEVDFEAPEQQAVTRLAAPQASSRIKVRPHTKPLVR
jgi:hypothetical protein